MRAITVALLLALACPATAAAQDATDPLAPARAIIDQAQAGDLFTPSMEADRITVHHNRSRLVCHFRPSERARIQIYSVQDGGPPRGDDVSCGVPIAGAYATFYATRYPQAVSVDDALAESVYEITHVSPQAREYESIVPRNPLEPISSRTQSFIIPNFMRQPGVFYSRTSVAVLDGWVYLMRFTGPEGGATEQGAEDAWRAFEGDLATAPTPAN
ncbi:MAG: hypothetical protein HY054_15885 [Proteobacteria bacterium]|nr:hypothetical protein [Pseudomonadota bacterium]